MKAYIIAIYPIQMKAQCPQCAKDFSKSVSALEPLFTSKMATVIISAAAYQLVTFNSSKLPYCEVNVTESGYQLVISCGDGTERKTPEGAIPTSFNPDLIVIKVEHQDDKSFSLYQRHKLNVAKMAYEMMKTHPVMSTNPKKMSIWIPIDCDANTNSNSVILEIK